MKPVVVVDGVPHALNSLQQAIEGEIAYVVGVNQSTISKVFRLVSARVFHFYEMRVQDISGLGDHCETEELAIHWNTKIADISPVCKLPNLKSLVLEDTPKINDLSPLERCNRLELLEFSGGIWNKNRVKTLGPIKDSNSKLVVVGDDICA